LRFFLIEAGQIAVRGDAELAQVYRRILMRGGHAKAKVAVGRRLLVRAFIMLRDGYCIAALRASTGAGRAEEII